ncbi:MAG: Cysteine desulfurase [uncultured Thermomicrobiales bacterium]|uniref:Cysteine desulfurase n=1 Tax=uncultured Thermomicrobiales bacterium TaxID=1645740 RepID=A0A6J4UJ88_9BACT|nr:MAG: Cysteine desulfurase [uncultured Thermomicrobiales bacterium]
MPLRDQFLLDPDVVFLNHGSFGACPAPVFDEYQRWQRELERQPVAFLGRRSDGLLDAARERLAAYLGADADDLVFVPNATSGLNVVARSLPLAADDEVLSTDLEYGALDQTWQHVCARVGARYVRQPVPLPVDAPAAVADAIWAGVTPRTKVLFLSHITSGTALTLPVAELCRRAREAGILSVVDGAHAPGQIPLDLAAIGADVYAGNCHKWLCAPKGSAFLHVRPDQQAWMESMIVSWGWIEGSSNHRPDRTFLSRNQWQGTRDLAAFLAVPAAIDFQAAHDWPSVRRACHLLAAETRARLEDLTGLPPISCEPSADGWPWFAQMVASPLPPLDAPALKRRLYDEYRIEVPLTRWSSGPLIRVSVQVYNTRDDADALISALARLLPEMTT